MNRLIAKTPLLLFTFGTGLLSSLSAALVKGITSQIAIGEFISILGKPLIYVLLPCTWETLFFQVNFMNLSLKYYEQLEVIPVYQSSIIFTNILFGAVIF